jgi:NAD(P)-dependent dehydrogenase (short-subunit alcohol dehydrogenase family)
VPDLVAQGEGHVVNTASIAGWSTAPTMAPYCASKHAVLAISEALRRELDAAEAGVGGSVLCPGMVTTRIMASERNWPAALGNEPPVPSDPATSEIRKVLTAGTTTGPVQPSAAATAPPTGEELQRRPRWSPKQRPPPRPDAVTPMPPSSTQLSPPRAKREAAGGILLSAS